MRKIAFKLLMLLSIIAFVVCSIKDLQNKGATLNKKEAENLISTYLDALSRKDLDDLKKYSTDDYGKGFTEEVKNTLEDTLDYAKLIKCELKELDADRVLVDAEVEIICYENSTEIGDWIPGKSISTKSFELVKINNEWKVNGWGVYW